jgi:hypothetical protein
MVGKMCGEKIKKHKIYRWAESIFWPFGTRYVGVLSVEFSNVDRGTQAGTSICIYDFHL